MLAMTCDYRVVRDPSKRNIWLCMNEVLYMNLTPASALSDFSRYCVSTFSCKIKWQVHFASVWPLSFAAVLRAKWGDHRLHRKIALEGHRFTPAEALDAGIVDYVVAGGTREVLAKAEEVEIETKGGEYQRSFGCASSRWL